MSEKWPEGQTDIYDLRGSDKKPVATWPLRNQSLNNGQTRGANFIMVPGSFSLTNFTDENKKIKTIQSNDMFPWASWNPSNKNNVAFCHDNFVEILDGNNGETVGKHTIKAGLTMGSYTPDGKGFVFCDGTETLGILDFESNTVRKIPATSTVGFVVAQKLESNYGQIAAALDTGVEIIDYPIGAEEETDKQSWWCSIQ